jgi:LPS sulfotransferase NodH
MATASYLVCATQRSGSTLLCEALKSTGVAGRPEEFFEARVRTGRPRTAAGYFRDRGAPDIGDILGDPEKLGPAPDHSKLDGIDDYAEHIERSFELGTTPNGVFGAKLMWGHLDDFTTFAHRLPAFNGLPLEDLLPAVFPKPRYVWVTRKDKVRQAVSLWKAIQTQSWRSGQEGGREREPVYHFEALHHLRRMLERNDSAWGRWFEERGIRPLELSYERIAADRATAVRAVLTLIGVDASGIEAPEPRLERQADLLSDDWVARYFRDRRTPD